MSGIRKNRVKRSAEKQSGVTGVTWSRNSQSWMSKHPYQKGLATKYKTFPVRVFGEADALQRAISYRNSILELHADNSVIQEENTQSDAGCVLRNDRVTTRSEVDEGLGHLKQHVRRIVFNVKAKNVYFM